MSDGKVVINEVGTQEKEDVMLRCLLCRSIPQGWAVACGGGVPEPARWHRGLPSLCTGVLVQPVWSWGLGFGSVMAFSDGVVLVPVLLELMQWLFMLVTEPRDSLHTVNKSTISFWHDLFPGLVLLRPSTKGRYQGSLLTWALPRPSVSCFLHSRGTCPLKALSHWDS